MLHPADELRGLPRTLVALPPATLLVIVVTVLVGACGNATATSEGTQDYGTVDREAITHQPTERRSDGAELIYEPGEPESAQNPGYLPSADELIFTMFHDGYNEGASGLFLLRVPNGTPIPLLDEEDQNAVNLPDGTWSETTGRFVFASDREDTDEVWTMDVGGGDLRRVTWTDNGHAIEPSFSPDGVWVVFQRSSGEPGEDQAGSLWKVRVDGDELTQLTSDTDDRQPIWSPDGAAILFQRRLQGGDDNWDLLTMAPDGTAVRPVVTGRTSDSDASWSPDSSRIVFSSNSGGLPSPNIFIVSATGGTPIRVTFNDGYEDSAPSWSPDGGWIAFESHPFDDEEAPAALWRIAVPTGE